ncbi:MAG: hypothetical protein MHM6MM_007716 [Cercozoa sp. M6MM]
MSCPFSDSIKLGPDGKVPACRLVLVGSSGCGKRSLVRAYHGHTVRADAAESDEAVTDSELLGRLEVPLGPHMAPADIVYSSDTDWKHVLTKDLSRTLFVFTYAIDDRSSFDAVPGLLEELKEAAAAEGKCDELKLTLLCCKRDRRFSTEEFVKATEACAYRSRNGFLNFAQTSATEVDNTRDAFRELVKAAHTPKSPDNCLIM